MKNKANEEPETVSKEKKPSVPRAPWRARKEEKAREAEEKAKAEGKTKPKKNKILASMPANWEEEEKKFFESGFSHNP